MGNLQRTMRLTTVVGGLIAGVSCAVAFCYLRPFDAYLLKSWEDELSTIADQEVEVRLEQIAALGERSLPTLVAALHSDRQLVAATAGSVLRRELDQLELRSTDESSRFVADLAHELAVRSNRPGPYSAPASTQLATRLLLWPINRQLLDGEQLVADCESILRSSTRSAHGTVAEQADEDVEGEDESASREDELLAAEMPTPAASGGWPVQAMDAPPLPPQNARVLAQSPMAATTEPPEFITLQTPRPLDASPSNASDKAGTPQSSEPLAVDPRKHPELRRDIAAAPSRTTAGLDVRKMADLELMRMLSDDEESRSRGAVDELYRRGFQTKHLRLAELLVDPDPNVRLALIRSLPQMSGINSRSWLLWLSRDPDSAVRKAAVAVIATSSDAVLLQRVRELEREETDEEVLRVVRQILKVQQPNTIR